MFPQYFSNALPYSYWALISSGIPQGMGLTHSFSPWSWTHEARQASFPIFTLFSCPLHPIWSVAFVQGVNWGFPWPNVISFGFFSEKKNNKKKIIKNKSFLIEFFVGFFFFFNYQTQETWKTLFTKYFPYKQTKHNMLATT